MSPSTSDTGIEELLEHLAEKNPMLHAIVLEVRTLVFSVAPQAEERVMYGGIVFEDPVMFCGVFAYSRHVSVEFGRGCDLDDSYGVLEGTGVRRHIKLRELPDVEGLHVREYLASAHAELESD